MRRYILYLAVALLAFGIGVFSVSVKFSQKTELKPIVFQTITESRIEKTKTIYNLVKEKKELPKQKDEFKCTDKILLAVWSYIGKYPDYQKDAKENFSNCSELFAVSEMIDLNSDGVDEAIIEGIHPFVNGMRGNKSIWICRKVGKTYKVILEDREQEYEVKRNVTNGYKDIFLKLRDDCCASYQTTYKFKKDKYRESKCLYINYGTTGIKMVSPCKKEE
ncbi:hypothetical protein BH10ACI1_BH10ACI1_12720 [soil metagenome]